jgi:prepilin-type N-terminal cleavage/methylation domain-containing protein
MNRSKGFTLAEIAVALVVVALLLGGALVPLTAQIDVRNFAETQRTQDQIKEAIIGFALANGRLPCPAIGATAGGTVDTTTWATPIAAGTEQWDPANYRCYAVFGVVPWATLGTAQTDSWGRRFSYRVSPAFADGLFFPSPPYAPGTPLPTWSSAALLVVGPPQDPPAPQMVPSIPSPANQKPACTPAPTPLLSSFALCSLGDIAVFTRNETTHAQVPIGSALPAVIISHGKNGRGAFQPTGIPVSPSPLGGSDEAANIVGNTVASPGGPNAYNQWAFFSRSPTPAASGCSDPAAGAFCEFDDLVVMISSSMLIARVVAGGRLP